MKVIPSARKHFVTPCHNANGVVWLEPGGRLLPAVLLPHLVDPRDHVLAAVLPVQELHVDVQLLLSSIVHARPREDADNLLCVKLLSYSIQYPKLDYDASST